MNSGSPNNQTRAYLMQRFETLGIHPRGKLGQNFLIDLNLLRLLYESAQLDKNDVVLEVGTGTGSLTGAMAQLAAVVVTVEVDQVMHEMAKQEHWDKDNIRFLFADILENKNRLNRHVLDAIREELALDSQRRFKLCANLPYQIATPLISNLLLSDVPPYSMTVTIQKEVGDRICAKPRTKDYGALAVWLQAQCDCRIVRIMPPSVFWPRPKVDSAIVQINYNPQKRAKIPNLRFYHEFVRALFFHRRKFLRSVLCSAFKYRLEKEVVDEVLEQMNLKGEIRAETLSVKTILAMSEKFRSRLPEDKQTLL
ncbi:MAG: 16S rRNA (adenine(1518)-N(6)/adenine(1519)-N(6))-dimethyltransferase RsmA [Planctomycetia bacterium]|nr:16S rRNA (adenine(1518)-N(6)/adenine(1519)-N(6))-dimethyltransferase RsmA [Planctomycetia bacterium]